MDEVIDMGGSPIRIVKRNGQFFVRYDTGAHTPSFREDEITLEEAEIILNDKDNLIQKNTTKVLYRIAARLESQGINPRKSNYSGEQYENEKK